MEDDLKRRGSQGKNTYMEEYLDGSQPQWKSYRKQMKLACLASQFCTELGPAQPQLVTIFLWFLTNPSELSLFLFQITYFWPTIS